MSSDQFCLAIIMKLEGDNLKRYRLFVEKIDVPHELVPSNIVTSFNLPDFGLPLQVRDFLKLANLKTLETFTKMRNPIEKTYPGPSYLLNYIRFAPWTPFPSSKEVVEMHFLTPFAFIIQHEKSVTVKRDWLFYFANHLVDPMRKDRWFFHDLFEEIDSWTCSNKVEPDKIPRIEIFQPPPLYLEGFTYRHSTLDFITSLDSYSFIEQLILVSCLSIQALKTEIGAYLTKDVAFEGLKGTLYLVDNIYEVVFDQIGMEQMSQTLFTILYSSPPQPGIKGPKAQDLICKMLLYRWSQRSYEKKIDFAFEFCIKDMERIAFTWVNLTLKILRTLEITFGDLLNIIFHPGLKSELPRLAEFVEFEEKCRLAEPPDNVWISAHFIDRDYFAKYTRENLPNYTMLVSYAYSHLFPHSNGSAYQSFVDQMFRRKGLLFELDAGIKNHISIELDKIKNSSSRQFSFCSPIKFKQAPQ